MGYGGSEKPDRMDDFGNPYAAPSAPLAPGMVFGGDLATLGQRLGGFIVDIGLVFVAMMIAGGIGTIATLNQDEDIRSGVVGVLAWLVALTVMI